MHSLHCRREGFALRTVTHVLIEILQRIYSSVFYLILYIINMIIIKEDYYLYRGASLEGVFNPRITDTCEYSI